MIVQTSRLTNVWSQIRGHIKGHIDPFSAGTIFKRQDLTSVDAVGIGTVFK